MNFSTNQVKQFYVLNEDSTVTPKVIKTPDGQVSLGLTFDVDGERTDIIPRDQHLYTTTVLASSPSEQLVRKGVYIALNDKVNEGNPVAGQDYVIKVTYRGHIGEEVTYDKFAEAHATTGMTDNQLLQALAASFLSGQNVEPSPLFELYNSSGALITKDNVNSITGGFWFVEPVPYWALGKFPETLMNLSISTYPIIYNADEADLWLTEESYKFAPVTTSEIASVNPICNAHKVADLEYFCKGEKGVSAALHMPYDIQIPVDLKVNPNASLGYDILTVHYAFVGANTSNQKSEKDMVFVIASNGEDTPEVFDTITDAIDALKA